MLPGFPGLRGAAAAAAALLSAAGCGVAPALQVHLTLVPEVRASCVQVSVYPGADVSGAPAESAHLVRTAGKDELSLAVFKGSLPEQVWVTARPLWGTDCQEPLAPNGAAVMVSAWFPASGVTPVELALSPLPVAEDQDGDGFVGPPGADCNDGNGAVSPGAAEHCLEAGDFDCDGRIGCADPDCPATACLAAPTALAFATPPRTLVAGACSGTQVVVETRNGAGQPQPVAVPTAVSFSSPDATLRIFSDALCLNALAGATIPVGEARASAFIFGTVAGSGTLQASAPGLGSATQVETVQPGATAELLFTSSPQTVPLGGCSEPAAVQLRDAFGNPTPVATALPLGLTSNGGGSFQFYPDAACALPAIAQATVAAGASAATFHFKSTAATPATVTITASDGPRAATQAVSLVVRTPTQLVFTSGPATVAQGACSPEVALQTQDALGQPAPVGFALDVGLSASPAGALTFYSDAACTSAVAQVTIGAGLSSGRFHFKGNQQGTATVTAAGGALGSPRQAETIAAPQPTQLAFASAAQTSVVAGQCSGAVDIEARDAGGNPIAVASDTQVDLTTGPAGQISLHAGPGCTGSPIGSVVLLAGASRVTLSFSGTLAASTTLTASTPGNVLALAQQVEGVVAAAAAKVRIVSGAGQVVDAGACSAAVTFELEDAFDNPVTAATAEVVDLSVTPAGAVTFHLSGTCTGSTTTAQVSAGAQRGQLYFQGSSPLSLTVTETPQNAGLTGDSAAQTIRVGSPTSLRFTSAAQSAVPAGSCSADVVLTTYDALSNVTPVSGSLPVALGATGLTGVSFFAGSGCAGGAVTQVTIPDGSSSTTYSFSTGRSGSGLLTATASGFATSTQPATVLPGAPVRLFFSLGPVTAIASFCSGSGNPLAIQAQDALGNPSPVPASVDVALSGANAATTYPITFYANNCGGGSVTTTVRINTGNTTSGDFFFKTNGAGTWTLTGSAAGLTSTSQDETVLPLAASSLVFTSAPQAVPVSQCSAAVTFQLQDSLGNAAPPSSPTGVSLTPGGDTFYTQSTCTGAISANTITLGSGQANGSFYFQAPASPGTYTIGLSTGGGIAGASQAETIQ